MSSARGPRPLRTPPRRKIRALALALAAAGAWWGFLPLQAEMSLNLVAVIEPYVQAPNRLFALQALLTLFARIALFPFVLWALYRVALRGLTALAARTGWAEMPAPPPPTHRSPPGRLSRLGKRYAWACVALLALEALFYGRFVVRAFEEPAGVVAFHQACGDCHSHVRAFNHNFPPEMWESTLARMHQHAELIGRPFPDEDREAITRFLVRTRSYSDERLLRSKCLTCHMPQHVFARRRSAEDWARIVDRIRRRNPFHLSPRDAERVARILAANPEWTIEAAQDAEHERKLLFQDKCGTCHTLDILFVPAEHGTPLDREEWETVLRRMGTKEPDLLDADQALEVLPLIEAALESKVEFLSDYPHSRMRER